MLRIEMLNEDEAHGGVEGQAVEQRREGLEPTGRGADTHDRERPACVTRAGRSVRCHPGHPTTGTGLLHDAFSGVVATKGEYRPEKSPSGFGSSHGFEAVDSRLLLKRVKRYSPGRR